MSAYNVSDLVTGVITKATETAVFVDIGAQVDAHLPRNFAKERFDYPELGMFQYLPDGTNISAWVAKVDVRRNRIQLSTEREKIGWLYMPSDANANEIDSYRSMDEFRRKFPEPQADEQGEAAGLEDEEDIPWKIVAPSAATRGMPLHQEWSIDDDDDDDDDERGREVDRFILDDFTSEATKSRKPKRGRRGGDDLDEDENPEGAEEDHGRWSNDEEEAVNGLIGGDGDQTLADFAGTGILSPLMTQAEIAAVSRLADMINAKLQRK